MKVFTFLLLALMPLTSIFAQEGEPGFEVVDSIEGQNFIICMGSQMPQYGIETLDNVVLMRGFESRQSLPSGENVLLRRINRHFCGIPDAGSSGETCNYESRKNVRFIVDCWFAREPDENGERDKILPFESGRSYTCEDKFDTTDSLYQHF